MLRPPVCCRRKTDCAFGGESTGSFRNPRRALPHAGLAPRLPRHGRVGRSRDSLRRDDMQTRVAIGITSVIAIISVVGIAAQNPPASPAQAPSARPENAGIVTG